VFIRAAFQQEHRLAQIAHHLGDESMDRGNIGDDRRHLGKCRGTGKDKGYDITHCEDFSGIRIGL
jgi:hypothetical protein